MKVITLHVIYHLSVKRAWVEIKVEWQTLIYCQFTKTQSVFVTWAKLRARVTVSRQGLDRITEIQPIYSKFSLSLLFSPFSLLPNVMSRSAASTSAHLYAVGLPTGLPSSITSLMFATTLYAASKLTVRNLIRPSDHIHIKSSQMNPYTMRGTASTANLLMSSNGHNRTWFNKAIYELSFQQSSSHKHKISFKKKCFNV